MGFIRGQKVYRGLGRNTKKLIRAAVEVYTEDNPPPAELRLAWQCERWHCLPEQGALLDQDYKLMRTMSGLSNIYDVVGRWQNAKGTRIHNLTEHDRKLLRYLLDAGIPFNAFG